MRQVRCKTGEKAGICVFGKDIPVKQTSIQHIVSKQKPWAEFANRSAGL